MCVCVFVYVCVGEYAHPRFFPCLSDGSKSYNIVAFSFALLTLSSYQLRMIFM